MAEDPGNYQPGNYVFQTLRTINAEEMKRLVKLMQTAKEQYEAQDDDETVETTEPEILRKTFPPIEESHEMNIANVIQTCNFLFRDGWVTQPHSRDQAHSVAAVHSSEATSESSG